MQKEYRQVTLLGEHEVRIEILNTQEHDAPQCDDIPAKSFLDKFRHTIQDLLRPTHDVKFRVIVHPSYDFYRQLSDSFTDKAYYPDGLSELFSRREAKNHPPGDILRNNNVHGEDDKKQSHTSVWSRFEQYRTIAIEEDNDGEMLDIDSGREDYEETLDVDSLNESFRHVVNLEPVIYCNLSPASPYIKVAIDDESFYQDELDCELLDLDVDKSHEDGGSMNNKHVGHATATPSRSEMNPKTSGTLGIGFDANDYDSNDSSCIPLVKYDILSSHSGYQGNCMYTGCLYKRGRLNKAASYEIVQLSVPSHSNRTSEYDDLNHSTHSMSQLVDSSSPTPAPVGQLVDSSSPTPAPVGQLVDSSSPTPAPVGQLVDSSSPTPAPVGQLIDSSSPTPAPVGQLIDSSSPTPAPVGQLIDSSSPTPAPVGQLIDSSSPTSAPVGQLIDSSSPTPAPVGQLIDSSSPTPAPVGQLVDSSSPTPAPVGQLIDSSSPTPASVSPCPTSDSFSLDSLEVTVQAELSEVDAMCDDLYDCDSNDSTESFIPMVSENLERFVSQVSETLEQAMPSVCEVLNQVTGNESEHKQGIGNVQGEQLGVERSCSPNTLSQSDDDLEIVYENLKFPSTRQSVKPEPKLSSFNTIALGYAASNNLTRAVGNEKLSASSSARSGALAIARLGVGEGTAKLVGEGTAKLVGEGTAKVVGEGTAKLVGEGTAKVVGEGTAKLVGEGTAKLVGEGTAKLVGEGTAKVVGEGTAKLVGEGTAKLVGEGTAKLGLVAHRDAHLSFVINDLTSYKAPQSPQDSTNSVSPSLRTHEEKSNTLHERRTSETILSPDKYIETIRSPELSSDATLTKDLTQRHGVVKIRTKRLQKKKRGHCVSFHAWTLIPLNVDDSKPDIGPESPAENKPDISPESPAENKPDIGPESPAEPKPDSYPESPAEPKPDRYPESPSESHPDRYSESPAEPKPDSYPESPGEPKPDSYPESPGEPEPDRYPESPCSPSRKRVRFDDSVAWTTVDECGPSSPEIPTSPRGALVHRSVGLAGRPIVAELPAISESPLPTLIDLEPDLYGGNEFLDPDGDRRDEVFISTISEENVDNFNPEWSEVAKIYDTRRYDLIQRRWGTTTIANPKRNLTILQFTMNQATHRAEPICLDVLNDEQEEQEEPAVKRPRLEPCTYILDRLIDQVKERIDTLTRVFQDRTREALAHIKKKHHQQLENRTHKYLIMQEHREELRHFQSNTAIKLSQLLTPYRGRIQSLEAIRTEILNFYRFYSDLSKDNESALYLSAEEVEDVLGVEATISSYVDTYGD
ncbi:hypothetical protein M8J76_000787 [Diaphorina citri]|nr:hypothetical protein M8J75_012641 [Diaphorina citri]KAI5729262.1 hypothetical protein M8J76_000787 [Diaphorina citri]KAI5734998.1 hypothetical protein M8J77_013006 [Diaphorina citri]